MPSLVIEPSSLVGAIHVPPSKSHSLRALFFAALAEGSSTIHNVLASPDTDAMVAAISTLGANVKCSGSTVEVEGFAGMPEPKASIIDAGNSGIVLRFASALAALSSTAITITGDASLCSQRPVQPLTDALQQLGAKVYSKACNGRPPLIIQGPIKPGHATLSGLDSQPVSALLIALSFLKGPSSLTVTNAGEIPWIGMTLSWMQRLGLQCHHKDFSSYNIKGFACYKGFEYTVPADFSTAAFPIIAALTCGSSITLHGLDPSDIQGDKKVISILQSMGGDISWQHSNALCARKSSLTGALIDINDCIDALPILVAAATQAKGPVKIYNGHIARYKESDRISAISSQLKKMGASITEYNDGVEVFPSKLHGAIVESFKDHRIAMALAVAGLAAEGQTQINDVACISKTYADFVKDMQKMGAKVDYL